MTIKEAMSIKPGEKLNVSYKGIRPCVFKNIRGKCAFVEFDSGDGTGVRLHRVLATTLIKPEPKAKKVVKKVAEVATPKSEYEGLVKGLSLSDAIKVADAIKTLKDMGFDVLMN